MKKCLFAVFIIACLLIIAGCASRAREPLSIPAAETSPAAAAEPVRTPAREIVQTQPAPVQPAPVQPAPVRQEIILTGASNYRTVDGDMLHLIAARAYGEENMYYFPLIRLANPSITNPDFILVGMNLIVPDLQRNLNSEGARILLKADMLSTAAYYDGLNRPTAAARLRELAGRL